MGSKRDDRNSFVRRSSRRLSSGSSSSKASSSSRYYSDDYDGDDGFEYEERPYRLRARSVQPRYAEYDDDEEDEEEFYASGSTRANQSRSKRMHIEIKKRRRLAEDEDEEEEEEHIDLEDEESDEEHESHENHEDHEDYESQEDIPSNDFEHENDNDQDVHHDNYDNHHNDDHVDSPDKKSAKDSKPQTANGRSEENNIQQFTSPSENTTPRLRPRTSLHAPKKNQSEDEEVVEGIKVGTYCLRTSRARTPVKTVTPTRSNISSRSNDNRNDRRRSDRKRVSVQRYEPGTIKRKRPSARELLDNYFEATRSRPDVDQLGRSLRDDYMLPVSSSRLDDDKQSKGDVDPIIIDPSINWESIGGLDHHVKLLKEMVMLPLLYPEIFKKFNITPPRGVLFYGPPGCGKTLVARALANSCMKAGQRVSFFMRKGADCLSKYVGEAERQLRLLFEQASRVQPSIIFFDEIDGLAPVRSSRQDQIHNSIVSTLLALMDGLDDRGKVVVIGATNRIDTIDPALRRPGRFDRELLFTLPTKAARKKILDIHTRSWDPPISDEMKEELSSLASGYCGADIKSLCTEAALQALRRSFPQIYESPDKLLIDVNKIHVTRLDFVKAMKVITPTAFRSSNTIIKPLPPVLVPLLDPTLKDISASVKEVFPFSSRADLEPAGDDDLNTLDLGDENEQIKEALAHFNLHNKRIKVHRPRFVICGEPEMGQAILASALLNDLEEFSIFSLDLGTLNSDPASKSPEDALVRIITESGRKLPSILFLPHATEWWRMTTPAMQHTLCSYLQDLDPATPLLLIATIDCRLSLDDSQYSQLPEELQNLLLRAKIYQVSPPTKAARMAFFKDVIEMALAKPIPSNKEQKKRKYPRLPKAPPGPPPEPSPAQLQAEKEEEEQVLIDLRMALRHLIDVLFREKKYKPFFFPVDPKEVPDYAEIVKEPMCFVQILEKIDAHAYATFDSFVEDMRLIVSNAEQFNPPNDPLRIASRARALFDHVLALSRTVSPKLIQACRTIAEKKSKREQPVAQPVEDPEPEIGDDEDEDDKGEDANPEEAEAMDGLQLLAATTTLTPTPTPLELKIDLNKLHRLETKLIDRTANYSVEQLHLINLAISNCIKKHAHEFDRTELLSELEAIVNDLKSYVKK